MSSTRLILGVVAGILLSFIMVSLFTMWQILDQIGFYAGTDVIKGIAYLMDRNFDFDIISFFISGPINLYEFLNPTFLSWIFIGYIAGTIVKGTKRSFLTSVVIVVIVILIRILMNIISGVDLMALFEGIQLINTLGGMLGALGGCILGGLLGAAVSGSYEEY